MLAHLKNINFSNKILVKEELYFSNFKNRREGFNKVPNWCLNVPLTACNDNLIHVTYKGGLHVCLYCLVTPSLWNDECALSACSDHFLWFSLRVLHCKNCTTLIFSCLILKLKNFQYWKSLVPIDPRYRCRIISVFLSPCVHNADERVP